jgi:hypothetical protein
MSIKKYTNIDLINNNSTNEGKFIDDKDLFILAKNEIEKSDFGVGKYDVMEVSVYDINNNLLPQKSGNNVAYIKKGSIQDYLYNITNKQGQKELAINIEKLLNELGFTNGILKVNINFVRKKVGSENELTRVWIQEVSPSRNEIRVLPLKTKDSNINKITNTEFKNLKSLNKDFIYYKNSILSSLTAFENSFLTKIDSYLETKFGKDFFTILKKDFGLTKFDNFRTKIFQDFKLSVEYYLTNKYYNITDSNFGKPDEVRFDDFDVYDYDMMLSEIQKILNNCIDVNSKILKRRSVEVKQLPTEFAITELRKQIQNNIESFSTFSEIKTNVYNPSNINVVFDDKINATPIIKEPVVEPKPIEILPVEPTPIYTAPPAGGGTYGGGGGGGYNDREIGNGLSKERGFEGDSNTRENIL